MVASIGSYGSNKMFPTTRKSGDLIRPAIAWLAALGAGLLVQAARAQVPAAPANFTATASNAMVNLAWSNVSGATNYVVSRSVTSGAETPLVTNGTATAYADAAVVNGTTYYYVAAARSAGGQSTNSLEASTTPQPPPGTPTGLALTAGGTWLALAWNAPTGTISVFRIARWVTGSAVTNLLLETAPYTTFVDFTVGAGTNYNYAVSAAGPGGQSVNSGTVTGTPTGATAPFVHPGALHVLADYTRMATNVAAGNDPWYHSYTQLAAYAQAQTNWNAAPVGAIVRASTGGNFARCQQDALAIYFQAIEYRITGNTNYATSAINLMNQWSGTLTNVTGDSNFALGAGLCGYEFACAGEELRGYAGWSATSQTAYKSMLANVFYAANNNFLTLHNGACDTHYWCNWDACNLASVIAIGVFCDDANMFSQAVAYYTNGLGNGNINLSVDFVHPNGLGQWQESGRDQPHTMDGINCQGLVCQVAWNQGVDLYGYDNNLYLRGLEYVCKYNLSNNVPYVHYQSCDSGSDQTVISPFDQGGFPCIWEMAYAHYVSLKGLAAPYTSQVAASLRPDGGITDWNSPDWFGFTSLTFYVTPGVTNAAPSGLTASVSGSQATLAWWGSEAATSYTVKRGTASGGPFTNIATVGQLNLYCIDPGLAGGVTNYYVVSANIPGGTTDNSAPLAVTPNALVCGPDDTLSGTVIGTTGSYGGNGTTIANVFDGYTNSFFDGPDPSGDWAGLDLGPGVSCVVTNVAYCPRTSYASRMTGGIFQGANDPNFTNPLTLFTITNIPNDGVLFSQPVTNSQSFRYLRYVGPANGYCDVGEVQFRGLTTGLTLPASPAGLTANAMPPSQVGLVWAPSAGATSYNIKCATNSAGPFTILENTGGTPYTNFIADRPDTGTNYYLVTALNNAGESAASAEITVTPLPIALTNLIWSAAVSGNWNTTATNWLFLGMPTVYANGLPVVFDDTAASTAVTVAATMSPESVIFNNSAKTYTVSGAGIGGSASLTMLGNGTTTLGGSTANAFSGGTVLAAGTLDVENTSLTPLGTGVVIFTGGTLENKGLATVTISNRLVTVANTTTHLHPATYNGTSLVLAGNLSGPGAVEVDASGSAYDSIYVSGTNSGFTGTFTVDNDSNQRFTFANPNTGSANATWVFNSAGTDEQRCLFTGTNTLAFGSLAGAGWFRNDAAGLTILRVGDLNTSTLFTGLIAGNGGDQFGLLKVGTGSLTMTGASTYTGPTTVSNGELVVSTAFAGNGAFAVTNGATLGFVNLSAGSALVSNLTVAAGTTLLFLNVSNPAVPLVTASNVFIGGVCTMAVPGIAGALTGRTCPLINYSGKFTGSFTNLQFLLPADWSGVLVSNANQIALTVTPVAGPELWSGGANGAWDIITSYDWKVNSSPATYADGSTVVFDDSAAGPTSITNLAAVTPASVTFSNSAKIYRITGSGIGGAGTLTLAGPGTVILANSNSYTGGTLISRGTLQLGDGVASIGVVAGNITNNAVLIFADSVNQTEAGVISGTGLVEQVTTNVLSLTGVNSFSGGLAVTAGTVYTSNSSGFGSSSNLITLGSTNGLATTVSVGGAWVSATQPVLVTGPGSRMLQGTWNNSGQVQGWGNIALSNATLLLQQSGASPLRYLAAAGITGTGNVIVTNTGSGTADFRTAINNTGWVRNDSSVTGGITFNNTGPGTAGSNVTSLIENSAASPLTLASANPAFTGTVQALAGSILVQNTGALNASNTVSVASGTAQNIQTLVDFQNVSATIAGLNDVNGAGGTVTDSTGTGVHPLTLAGRGNYFFSGVITAAAPTNLALTVSLGSQGSQTLNGPNAYAGATTVNSGALFVNGSLAAGSTVTVSGGGLLGGAGTIFGPTTLNAGAVLAPGANSAGTLTFGSNLVLNATVTNDFAVTASGASNHVIVAGQLKPNGSVIHVTTGAPLPGGTNLLFNYGAISGSFNPVPTFDVVPPGAASIVDDGAGHINLVVANTVNTTPANLIFQLTGGTVALSWPADHVGWTLEAQTNPVTGGLGTNWVRLPASTITNQMNWSLATTNGCVFFRLVYP